MDSNFLFDGGKMKVKKGFRNCLFSIRDWIMSYLVILTIPIVICSVFYMYTYLVIWKEAKDSNAVALQIVASELDDIFKRTFSVEYAIQRNGDIQEAVSIKQPLDAMKRFRLVKAAKAAGSCVGDDAVGSLMIYYPNSEMVLIAGSGYINHVDSYERIGKYYGYNYEEWERLLNERNNKKFLLNSDTGEISYIVSLPMHKTAINMNVILGLDSYYVQNILSKLDNMSGAVFLMDTDNQILACRNVEWDDFEGVSEQIAVNEEYHMIILNEERMMASCVQLKNAELKVVSVIPYREFWSKSISSLIFFYFALTLSIFIGLVVSYFFSASKAKTWGKLNALAKVRVEDNKSHRTSRNKEIERAIWEIVEEYNTMQQQLSSVNTMKRELLLRSTLKGRIREDEIEQTFIKNGVVFELGNYVVVVFKLNSFKNFLNVGEHGVLEQDVHLVRNAVISIIEDFNHEFSYEILNVDENVVCIVNLGQMDKAECYEQIDLFSQSCRELLVDRLSTLLTISISDVHKHICSLQNAYSEVSRVMEYQNAVDDEPIMNYLEMLKRTQSNFSYSTENENTLIYLIFGGKEKEALQLIEAIYEENFIGICSSNELSNCLKWNIVASILQAESMLKNQIGLLDMQDFLEDIDRQSTLKETKIILAGRIKHICELVLKTKKEKGDLTAERIKTYIQDNYDDPNLSNSQMADHFQMNSAYFSTFFKEKTGLNVLTYIQKVRINEAKELLKSTDLTLEEIGKRVGCNNSVSLVRLFKKYEGITPTAYRKESRQ